MLKAIAIDDEPLALEVIKKLAEKVLFLDLGACFTDPFQAGQYLANEKIDLLFLDIKMPDISGIEFLHSLKSPPLVIFTTAHSEYAVQSFELDAVDYLLKPFSLARFLKACNKAQGILARNKPEEQESIFIKSGYETIKVELNSIYYVESTGNYLQFVTDKETITARMTMEELKAVLPQENFIRVHRSFVISKNKITRFDKKSIWVKSNEIPIGQAYQEAVNSLGK